MTQSRELNGHLEHNSEQLADFLASKDRLAEHMTTARVDIHALRSQVAVSRREFASQLEYLRKQVAPLFPAEQAVSKTPHAPPSTPAG